MLPAFAVRLTLYFRCKSSKNEVKQLEPVPKIGITLPIAVGEEASSVIPILDSLIAIVRFRAGASSPVTFLFVYLQNLIA